MAKFELSEDERQDIAERVAKILKEDIPAPIQTPKTYTVNEVGKILNLHPLTVRKHCAKGLIPATKQGQTWIISHQTLNKIIEK